MNEFLKILYEQIDKRLPLLLNTGKVKSVDKDKCTIVITPDDKGDDLPDVRLRAVIDDNQTGVLLFPKVDSAVVYASIENQEANCMVLMFSEIEEFLITGQGGFKVETDNSGNTKINNGNFGGLVKIEPLNNNLNAVKTYFTTLQAAVVAGFNAIGAGMSANGANGVTAFNTAMSGQNLTYEDMENTKIKH